MTYATSPAGLALIQQYEGYRAEPAQMPDGNWVVGHGHVRVGEAGAQVNAQEAASLLAADVALLERLVNARVSQPLTQSQFDALVSFAMSIGAEAFEQSQVVRRLNAGEYVAAACAMDAWRKSDVGGELVVVAELVRRRAAEKALFLQELPHDASPSAFLRAKLDYAASILGAPVSYAPAPVVGSIPMAQAKPEPVERLTEILKSEPQTETVLLTQPVVEEVAHEDEIVTAHAKPIPRPLDGVREATRRAHAQQEAQPKKAFSFFKRADGESIFSLQPEVKPDRRIRDLRNAPEGAPRFELPASFENLGLVALSLFGLVLVTIGVLLALNGQGFDMIAGAAVSGPGLVATGLGIFGLWRSGDDAANA